jgi:hypothetical protein
MKKPKLDADSEILLSQILGIGNNQSRASRLRETERELLQIATPPCDLKSIPESDRHKHDEDYVTTPQDIQDYLIATSFPLSENEIEALQTKMETHHGVVYPSYIVLMPDFAATGKNHVYIEDLEKYRTGFVYSHES